MLMSCVCFIITSIYMSSRSISIFIMTGHRCRYGRLYGLTPLSTRVYHGVGVGSTASGTVHLSASAAFASALVELTHGIPMPPLMLSHIMTGGPPHGEVTLKSLNLIFSQTAFGLELQVKDATARPYLPEVYPVKFSNRTLVMLTCDG